MKGTGKTIVLERTAGEGKIPTLKLSYNQLANLPKLAVYQNSSDINELCDMPYKTKRGMKRWLG